MVKHKLVPEHELLSPEEAQKVLDKYNVGREQMPKIKLNDHGIKDLSANVGDVIRITREHDLIGNSIYYRVVVE